MSFTQRIIYVDGLIYWLFGVQKMVYILCPIIYLIFGVAILNASVCDLILFWIPSFVASILTFRALVQKIRSITWSHIYEVAMAHFLALSAVVEAVFSRPIPFKVTPKGTISEKTSLSLRVALPHITLFALTVLGWVLIIPRFYSGSLSVINFVAINISWSIYYAFEAMTSQRPYRKSLSQFDAINELVKYSGSQFDPAVVKSFTDSII